MASRRGDGVHDANGKGVRPATRSPNGDFEGGTGGSRLIPATGTMASTAKGGAPSLRSSTTVLLGLLATLCVLSVVPLFRTQSTLSVHSDYARKVEEISLVPVRSSSVVCENPLDSTPAPLPELTATVTEEQANCTAPNAYVPDTVLDPRLAYAGNRKIPRIVHITGLSRCNHDMFARNIDRWRLKDHSLFYHDDEAVARLFRKHFPEFPNLQLVLECLPQRGAIWADVWRLLVLWEYGGIYTDMDTAPKPHMFNETTIAPEDDAFFVIETLGTPSQWFMAASPRHPMIYFCIQHVLRNLIDLEDVGNFPVVWTTGPGAVGMGFFSFTQHRIRKNAIKATTYAGVGGRTVRLVGSREDQDMYLQRVISSDNDKRKAMSEAGMTHLSAMKLKGNKKDVGCMERIWDRRINEHQYDSRPLWD